MDIIIETHILRRRAMHAMLIISVLAVSEAIQFAFPQIGILFCTHKLVITSYRYTIWHAATQNYVSNDLCQAQPIIIYNSILKV